MDAHTIEQLIAAPGEPPHPFALTGGDIACLTHVAILPGCEDDGIAVADIVPKTIFTPAYIERHLEGLARRGLIGRRVDATGTVRFMIAGGE